MGESQFDTILEMPFAWHWQANVLMHAAEVLLKVSWRAKQQMDAKRYTHHLSRKEERIDRDFNVHFPAGFLIGLGIENHLKEVWLRQNLGHLERTGHVPEKMKTHDLIKLCDGVGITTTTPEKAFLRLLSDSKSWYGRYPIPLRRDSYSAFWTGRKTMFKCFFTEYPGRFRIPKVLESILQKISEKVSSNGS